MGHSPGIPPTSSRGAMSNSIGLRLWKLPLTRDVGGKAAVAHLDIADATGRGPRAVRPGAQHPMTLRFLDRVLERRYQLAAGAKGLGGLRMMIGMAGATWLIAAFVVPVGIQLPAELATPICCSMAGVSAGALLVGWRAKTADRQHLIVAILSATSGVVILWLASVGSVLPGYGVSAIMLLFAYGAVSRTGFVFAAWRSAVIVVGFIVAAAAYRGPGSLLFDAFIFAAAVIGSILAMRLLEQSRRRVFYQDVVIADQSESLRLEKDKSDRLLLNVLPASISARLRDGEEPIADEYPSVTVLFADIVGFTAMAERLRPVDVVHLLGRLFGRFDELLAERGLEKIKTMGDGYIAAGGLPEPIDDHAGRVVDLALAMIEAAQLQGDEGRGVPLRIGVHSGPVLGGVIGHEKFAFDMWGDTVNVASRLESHGVPNRVHVSDATWQLLGHRFEGTPRGSVDLRGHGSIESHLVLGRTAALAPYWFTGSQAASPEAQSPAGRQIT
jgi:class 3 adenylate cyclase